MGKCGICELIQDACKDLVGDENKKICEELGNKLSSNEINVDQFFIELKDRLKIRDKELIDRVVEIVEKDKG